MRDQIRRGRKVEYHSRGYTGRKLPLVSVRGTDFAEMRLMFKSSLGIKWHGPLERCNVPATHRNGTSSAFVDEFASILHLSIRAICGETTWTLTAFGRSLAKFESRKLYVVPLALLPKADLKIFFCVYHPVSPSLKPSSTYILCFFNQSLEIARNSSNSKHPLRTVLHSYFGRCYCKSAKHCSMRNNVTCSTNCKYRTDATLYTLETWFVSGIWLYIPCIMVIIIIIRQHRLNRK